KGTVDGRGTITTSEGGGFAPYAVVVADLPNKEGVPEPSNDLNPDGYVEFRFLGADHSVVGNQVVLFLGRLGQEHPLGADYFMISASHGRLTWDTATNSFIRGQGTETAAERLAGFESRITEQQLMAAID
ncbi:MAG: hypothetical protein LBL92_04485, partial [Propionibacteriaceae bacterium]|nr:hypothetical protein [Propionibacteriaceae bacterium]